MAKGSSVLRPHGIVIVSDVDGKSYQSDTLTCCHCGNAWVVKPGSGRMRGFCQNCMGPTCGELGCLECVPVEKRLDDMESGKRKSW